MRHGACRPINRTTNCSCERALILKSLIPRRYELLVPTFRGRAAHHIQLHPLSVSADTMDDDEIPVVAHGPLVADEREAVTVRWHDAGLVGQYPDVGVLVGEGPQPATLGQDLAHGTVRQHVAGAAGVRRVVEGRVLMLRDRPWTVDITDDAGVLGYFADVQVVVWLDGE